MSHDKNYIDCCLGAVLRRLRNEAGVTINDLSADMDASPAFMSRLERGEHSIRVAWLAKYCALIEAPLKDVMDETNKLMNELPDAMNLSSILLRYDTLCIKNALECLK